MACESRQANKGWFWGMSSCPINNWVSQLVTVPRTQSSASFAGSLSFKMASTLGREQACNSTVVRKLGQTGFPVRSSKSMLSPDVARIVNNTRGMMWTSVDCYRLVFRECKCYQSSSLSCFKRERISLSYTGGKRWYSIVTPFYGRDPHFKWGDKMNRNTT